MELAIALIIFVAVFAQAFTGFAYGLVAMPLLTGVIGIHAAAPLVAIVGMIVRFVMLIHYRQHLSLRAVGRLTISATVGVPLGVLLLENADEHLVKLLLGLLIIAYALYSLFGPKLPEIKNQRWEYGVGFIGGILGGAYNTPGPPLVMYATAQRWHPAEFKCNLQSVFLFNGVFVLLNHGLHGNFTVTVWSALLIALPATALGLATGFAFDRWATNPKFFQRVVLLVLLVIGIQLIL